MSDKFLNLSFRAWNSHSPTDWPYLVHTASDRYFLLCQMHVKIIELNFCYCHQNNPVQPHPQAPPLSLVGLLSSWIPYFGSEHRKSSSLFRNNSSFHCPVNKQNLSKFQLNLKSEAMNEGKCSQLHLWNECRSRMSYMVTCQARMCNEPKHCFPRVEGKTVVAEPRFLIDGGTNSNYRLQTKFAEVMFLHLSVILFAGGCLPLVWGEPPGQTLPPGQTSTWVDTPLDRHTPWADTPMGIYPSGKTPHEHYGIQSTSGRYVSYWNAFLFC